MQLLFTEIRHDTDSWRPLRIPIPSPAPRDNHIPEFCGRWHQEWWMIEWKPVWPRGQPASCINRNKSWKQHCIKEASCQMTCSTRHYLVKLKAWPVPLCGWGSACGVKCKVRTWLSQASFSPLVGGPWLTRLSDRCLKAHSSMKRPACPDYFLTPPWRGNPCAMF